jgi:general secretion pathway protein A
MNQKMKMDEKGVRIFGWKENPFNFKILPDLLAGYKKEIRDLVQSLQNDYKVSMLIGPTGSGKTTILKYIAKNLGKDMKIFYLSKPPKKPEDLVRVFMNFIQPGFLEKLFSREKNVNIYNLSEWVNKKMKKKKMVLLVDEAHEASIETLEWLRTLADQIDNLSLIIAGLPTLENILRQNLETFMRRVNTRVELSNLTKTETRELIKMRIEWAGGEDIKPFTSETIEYIYEKTGGFPREVIRLCNELVQNALQENITTIDKNFIKESGDVFTTTRNLKVTFQPLETLPTKQRRIIEILWKYGELTPTEIVDKMGVEDYKNKDNAIRSVNNILKRLVNEGSVIRKRRGKTYQYLLSEKMRTIVIDR